MLFNNNKLISVCALLLNARLLKRKGNNSGILQYDIVTKGGKSPGQIQLKGGEYELQMSVLEPAFKK